MGQMLSSTARQAENTASASPSAPEMSDKAVCYTASDSSSRLAKNVRHGRATTPCDIPNSHSPLEEAPEDHDDITQVNMNLTGTPRIGFTSSVRSKPQPRKYVVFVSHAGEDKHTFAIPLRKMLSKRTITAFVDERDIPPGATAIPEMTYAMENADVAVIVLSPEFVAKKWPMKELLFFLHRRENAQAKGESLPVIIPVFYRLSVADMYTEPNYERKTADGKSLYRVTRFFERRDDGEPEADVEIIRRALQALHGIMGGENRYHASNEESSMPSRQLLLNDTCEKISQAIAEHGISTASNEEATNTSDDTEQFRRHFHTEHLRNVVLDFERLDANNEPVTYEGRIKRRILNYDINSDQVIAIQGMGGVGKSTILKALVNDKDLRKLFRDGIHFMSLGMDATVPTLVEELSRVLRDCGANEAASKLQNDSRSDAAIRRAISDALEWIDGKTCLFLIDDVWTKEFGINLFAQVAKLGGVGRQSCVVLTTRESEIASVAPNQESIFKMTPREWDGEQARAILCTHAGMMEGNNVGNCTSDAISGVLEICAGLPVSLAAAGKGVKMMATDMGIRDGDIWKEYLEILSTCREQLIRENVGEYGDLYITLRASIALLEGREVEKLGFETPAGFAEMHRRLCVLQKQDRAPMRMLRHLWELKVESEARVVAKRFVEVGLAEHEYRTDYLYDHQAIHLDMHDSIHDFAISEAKRHKDVARAHKVLLDAGYSRSYQGKDWSRNKWAKASWCQIEEISEEGKYNFRQANVELSDPSGIVGGGCGASSLKRTTMNESMNDSFR